MTPKTPETLKPQNQSAKTKWQNATTKALNLMLQILEPASGKPKAYHCFTLPMYV